MGNGGRITDDDGRNIGVGPVDDKLDLRIFVAEKVLSKTVIYMDYGADGGFIEKLFDLAVVFYKLFDCEILR